MGPLPPSYRHNRPLLSGKSPAPRTPSGPQAAPAGPGQAGLTQRGQRASQHCQTQRKRAGPRPRGVGRATRSERGEDAARPRLAVSRDRDGAPGTKCSRSVCACNRTATDGQGEPFRWKAGAGQGKGWPGWPPTRAPGSAKPGRRLSDRNRPQLRTAGLAVAGSRSPARWGRDGKSRTETAGGGVPRKRKNGRGEISEATGEPRGTRRMGVTAGPAGGAGPGPLRGRAGAGVGGGPQPRGGRRVPPNPRRGRRGPPQPRG